MLKLVLNCLVLIGYLMPILGQERASDSCPRALLDMLDQANQDLKYLNKTYKREQSYDPIKDQLANLGLALEQHTAGFNHAQFMFNGAKIRLVQQLDDAELLYMARVKQFSAFMMHKLTQKRLMEELLEFQSKQLVRLKKLLN